ncbi:Thiolase, N-terminal domain-containing protein [Rhexocercosporidium sp. MPI-PUGE-AT-0058]|nr:Thiolase, N-terminal domain-containing protein [Rhexocercosporidium sp. MPI-PUGE-AT-0058]
MPIKLLNLQWVVICLPLNKIFNRRVINGPYTSSPSTTHVRRLRETVAGQSPYIRGRPNLPPYYPSPPKFRQIATFDTEASHRPSWLCLHCSPLFGLGNVLHPSANFVIRTASIAAGFPATTASSNISRWCSSGLVAVQSVANQITAGSIDVGLAIGAESMSNNPDNGAPELRPSVFSNPVAKDATESMGWTSENVTKDFGISRASQDEFAAASFQKAEASQKAGWPEDEILPITVNWVDPTTKEVKTVVADKDDGPVEPKHNNWRECIPNHRRCYGYLVDAKKHGRPPRPTHNWQICCVYRRWSRA